MRSGDGAENDSLIVLCPLPSTWKALPTTKITPCCSARSSSIGIGAPLGDRGPEEEPAFWRRPGQSGSQSAPKRLRHDVPLVAVEVAQSRSQPVGNAQTERFVDDVLIEDSRREICRLLRGLESLDQHLRRLHPADAEARRQHFRHRAQIQHAAGPIVGSRSASSRLPWRHRRNTTTRTDRPRRSAGRDAPPTRAHVRRLSRLRSEPVGF